LFFGYFYDRLDISKGSLEAQTSQNPTKQSKTTIFGVKIGTQNGILTAFLWH